MCLRFVISLPILIVVCRFVVSDNLVKCCNKHLEVNDSKCVHPDKISRYEIYTDVSSSEYRGQCFDISKNQFYLFQANNGTFNKLQKIPSNFNKCCPLGFSYNKIIKSCDRSNITNDDLFKGIFITIGLEDCKLAVDQIYETIDEFDKHVNTISKSELYCSDRTVDRKYIIRKCQKDLEICLEKRCFKKCCPEGQSFVGGPKCQNTWVHGIQTRNQYFSSHIQNIEDDFEIIYGTKCPRISTIKPNSYQYQIKKNGSFRYFYNYTKEFVEQDVFNFKSYCIEHVEKVSEEGYFMFDCYATEVKEKYIYTMGFKILSSVFLLLTMAIYIYTGETKNIFGKILLNYCVSILFLMVTLLVAHLNLEQTLSECKIRGYFITWLSFCSFTWLNIMSLNIWRTFSQPHGTTEHSKQRKDIKKFMLYSIYGWGVPILIVFIVFVLEFTKCLPEPIHPYIGIFYCMFEKRNYAPFFFYLLPQLIFQFINTVFFFKTIIYCIKVKNEINKLNEVSRSNDNRKLAVTKEKLGLIIKLAIVMGVIYVFEVASGFFNDIEKYGKFAKILEIIIDSILSSQDDFEIIYGTKCPRISIIRPDSFQYQITKNGSFRYFYNYTKEFVEQDVFNFKSYCIEHVEKGSMKGYFMFDCYATEVEEKYTYTMGFKILSSVFLLLTMIIYIYTGETKNIFGKILMSYCVSILFLMVTLLVAHLNLEQTLSECKIRGYFITWLSLCSFTWLNIMSLNIWCTFSQPYGTIGHSQKRKNIKKFMLYSIYGWGVPILIVFTVFVLEFTKCLPEPIHPYIGTFYCMFEKRNYAPFLFYLLPQLIFQFINTVVFFKTIIYCIKVKNEINKLNEASRSNDNGKFAATKEKLGLIIKLAIVMGVIYVFEVATGFFNDIEKYGKFAEILEIILYSILSSQGIFIFAIFICKKKTIEKLKKKLNIHQRKTSESLSSTQTSFHLFNRRQPTKISLNGTSETKP